MSRLTAATLGPHDDSVHSASLRPERTATGLHACAAACDAACGAETSIAPAHRRRARTCALLAANVAMFAAVAIAAGSIRSFSPRDLIWWGAGFGPRTTNGEWWRLLTATVLHAHLPHLILNMIALLMIGPIVERLVGRRAFVAFYVACGLAGSAAASRARNCHAGTPLIT